MGAATIARNCFGEGQTCVGIDWNKSRGRTRNAHDEEEQRGTRELAEDGEEGPVCDDDTETLYGLEESEGMELLSYRQDDQACKTGVQLKQVCKSDAKYFCGGEVVSRFMSNK